jgi:prevent-host-death family protein
MKHKTVSATKFRAKCFAYLDEVQQTGVSITITRGRPVAVLSPAKIAWKSPANMWAGKVRIVGDIVNFSVWEDCGTVPKQ